MESVEHTTFIAVLQKVPDPRKACGKRHTWLVLITLISTTVVVVILGGVVPTLPRLFPKPLLRAIV